MHNHLALFILNNKQGEKVCTVGPLFHKTVTPKSSFK